MNVSYFTTEILGSFRMHMDVSRGVQPHAKFEALLTSYKPKRKELTIAAGCIYECMHTY